MSDMMSCPECVNKLFDEVVKVLYYPVNQIQMMESNFKTKLDIVYTGDHDDIRAEAFNIMLVVTGLRDVMLMQAFEDESEQQNIGHIVSDLVQERYVLLNNLLKTYVNVVFDTSNDVLVYSKSTPTQNQAKLLKNLDYECEFPNGESKMVGSFMLKERNSDKLTHMYSVQCEEVSTDTIEKWMHKREKFQKLGDILNVNVELHVDIRE